MIKRTVAAILLTVIMLSAFISCAEEKEEPGFGHAELVLPLPFGYVPDSEINFDKAYSNGETKVAVLRISFEAASRKGISVNFTPEEYGKHWLIENERDSYVRSDPSGFAYCDYTELDTYHLAAFFRSLNAYFVVIFATAAELGTENREGYVSICREVRFTDNNYRG